MSGQCIGAFRANKFTQKYTQTHTHTHTQNYTDKQIKIKYLTYRHLLGGMADLLVFKPDFIVDKFFLIVRIINYLLD